jgi:hypothetical protein
MWKRVNYLTGLTRPSKYTGTAVVTNTENEVETTGAESQFIYPPMIEFRIGDLYVDQPAVLRSVNISIPDDAHWETLRGDVYQYVYGANKFLEKNVPANQLPTIIDVSVQLSVIEKVRSITDGYHFGPLGGWNETTGVED